MSTGHTRDPAQAYIAAFIVYLKDLEKLSEPYDSSKHIFVWDTHGLVYKLSLTLI